MSAIWDNILNKINQSEKDIYVDSFYDSSQDTITGISKLTLKELSKRDMAIPIYSKLLNEEIWFCSNQYMIKTVKKDNPKSTCYLASELLKILKTNPNKEHLMKLHLTKKVFEGTVLD